MQDKKNMIIVSVRCLVYNQKRYIKQCLDGIVMQKTSFPYEAIIHDDASTDGTAEIIKEYACKYPNIIKPILEKENQYSKHDGSIRKIMNQACKGKYIAYCEGDDYWTDPHKLQKQVDIMESDKDVMMVYTGFETVNKEGQVIYRFDYDYNMKQSMSGFVLPFFLYRNVAMTVSCMFRKEVFLCNYKKGCNSSLDYLSFLCAAALGKVAYINEKTCCYRKVSSSLTNSNKTGIQKEVIRVLDYMTTLYEKGEIQMSKIQHLKTKLYIVAKGIDLYIKGLGIIYFKTHSLRANMLLFIFPGLLLETYHLLKYYYNKMESSHE